MGKVMLVEELAGTKASKGPRTSCWAPLAPQRLGP